MASIAKGSESMTTISIVLENPETPQRTYRAVAGSMQSVGGTVGEALDALTSKLGEAEGTTLVIVQQSRPDRFFTEQQQRRLQELMARWREARGGKAALTAEEQVELDSLVEAEVRAAKERAAAMVSGLAP
jgi:hypothetical protein